MCVCIQITYTYVIFLTCVCWRAFALTWGTVKQWSSEQCWKVPITKIVLKKDVCWLLSQCLFFRRFVQSLGFLGVCLLGFVWGLAPFWCVYGTCVSA